MPRKRELKNRGTKPAAAAPRLASDPRGQSLHRIALLLALSAGVVGAVAFAHWPMLSCRTLNFDDEYYLTHNELVQQPSWATASRFLSEVLEPSTIGGYYQPLAMISLMLDYAAAGPDNLEPFHRTSLILHLANTALVIALVYGLFRNPWIAAASGLLFGVHPMTVEPIAWVGERKTPLAAFFGLFCLGMYVRYATRGGWKAYAAALVFFLLALLSKPITTPLPLFLVLIDWWPLNRLNRRTLLEKAPFFALSGVFAVITVISQARTAAVGMPGEDSIWRMPLIVLHDIAFYAWKIVLPINLTSHYPVPKPLTWANPHLLIAVAAALVIIAAAVVSLRWTRAPLVAFAIFVLGVFPTMGLIGFTNVLTSDKYAYLPAIGLLIAGARALQVLAGGTTGQATPWRPKAVAAGVLVLALALTCGTRLYLREWVSTVRHDAYMFRMAPDSPHLYMRFANRLSDERRYAEAIVEFNRAISLNPLYPLAYNNRGIAYGSLGDGARAIQDITRAIELKPEYAEAYYNRAISLHNLGDLDGAIRDYSKAIELRRRYSKAYYNRATAWQAKGDLAQAIRDFSAAIELKPRFAEAYHGRAVVQYLTGNYAEAWADLRVVKQLGGVPNAAFVRDLMHASSRPGA